jgi:hypothetical protein
LVLGAVSLIAPLTIAAFWFDPNWPREYLSNLSVYGVAGVAQVAMHWGSLGEIVLLAALAVISVILVRFRSRDGLAIALALSVIAAPMQSPYAAIFGLPALVRVAARTGYLTAVWIVNDAIWLAFIGTVLMHAVYLASAAGLLLLIAAYPLVRSSATSPADDRPVGPEATTAGTA